MTQVEANPLFQASREKSGAITFKKFDYQYHWALYRVIEEHSNQKSYAVFVELHEDVVFADSLEAKKVQFEFNQIKTTKGSFTEKSLTKKIKGASVLGKILSSCINKKFSSKIKEINLVALNGFRFDLKTPGITKEKFKLDDLSCNSLDEVEEQLKKELACESIPKNIFFITPKLPGSGYQDHIIGKISVLVDKLFPNSQYSSTEIYRLLIDELHRKGSESIDYEGWDDVLEKKALTSEKVESVIRIFTSVKGEEKTLTIFDDICGELKLGVNDKIDLRKAFDRYRIKRTGGRSSNQLNLTKTIEKLLNTVLKDGQKDMAVIIKTVSDSLPQKIQEQLLDDQTVRAAIITEFIIMRTKDVE